MQPSGNLFGLTAGAGMQEIYQITSALKNLPFCKHVAVLTDARFSGVSTGACIGHISPEALAGGPIGRVREGDTIEIVIDRDALHGTVDLVGEGEERFSAEEGGRRLASRVRREDLAPHPALSNDTRLWAALIQASGGVWGGCVMIRMRSWSNWTEVPPISITADPRRNPWENVHPSCHTNSSCQSPHQPETVA